MKIYILSWLDSDADFVSQFSAHRSKKEAMKAYGEIDQERLDITIGSPDEAIRLVDVKDKEDLIDVINSLSL